MRACARPRAPPSPESGAPRSCRTRNRSSFASRFLITGARYLEQRAILKPESAQRAAPDAATVESDHRGFAHQAELGPVTEDQGARLLRPRLVPAQVALGGLG